MVVLCVSKYKSIRIVKNMERTLTVCPADGTAPSPSFVIRYLIPDSLVT